MAAVQQHTPSNESRGSKAFMESMEEEMRRCSEHLQRRQSKRILRTLNGYGRGSDDGEEAGAGMRYSSTLPRSFTMPSNPETREIPYSRHPRRKNHSPSRQNSRSPRTPTMKAPIGATFHDAYSRDHSEREQMRTPEYRGRSAPPECTSSFTYYTSSSGSEFGCSSRESSVTPLGMSSNISRSSSASPRSSMSPPPVAPKPNGRSRERAWSNKRRNKGEDSPRVIRAKPEESPNPQTTIPVSNHPIQVPLSPMEFPSADIEPSTFTGFNEISPRTPPLRPEPKLTTPELKPKSTSPEQESKLNTTTESEPVLTTLEQGPKPTTSEWEPKSTAQEPESKLIAPEIEPKPASISEIETKPTIQEPEPDHQATIAATEAKLADTSTPSTDNQSSECTQVDGAQQESESLVEEPENESLVEETKTDQSLEGKTSPPETEEAKSSAPEVLTTATEREEPSLQEESVPSPLPEESRPLPPPVEVEQKSSSPPAEVRDMKSSSPPAEVRDMKSSSPPAEVRERKSSEADHRVNDEQSLQELTSPEVKTVPRTIRRKSTSREGSPKIDGSPSKKRHSRNLSESKIHITVSSSVKMGEVIQSSQDKNALEGKPLEPSTEEMAAMIKDLQAKLREKEEQVSQISAQREKEVHERDEQIKKLGKDNKKIEREKWELLKRARDAAERALHLRTQLDMKEGSIRSTQSKLDRTKDELFSVKSANTSLRALLSELRAPRSQAPGVEVGVQVEIVGGALKRNRSMELAFTEGGVSKEVQENSFDRSSDFRTSTSSLTTHWPQRSNSEKWEREDSVSLSGELSHTLPVGVSSSQPNVPWPDLKKGKRKRSGLLTGKLRRSTGSKRGSVTSVDGLDMSNSSILQGTGMRGTAPITFPYHVVPTDMKEHWRLMEQAQSIPFNEWTLQHIIAWIEAGLGMNQYSEAVKEKAPTGAAILSLSDSDLEKKLGISHSLHRKKLRLAIEEQRDPSRCHYPHASKIDHSWIAYEWAHDCGLAHLTEVLVFNLVDGRMLNTLTKDDIRKHLKITKKTDQMSFLSAVELLRMHDFNRQAIQEHRRTANNPLYWTNREVCDWLKDIQLEEYATNVIGGGVHGALLFLERGHFTADHLASIIQIPSSKGQLRRHLAGKMASLFTEDVSQSIECLPAHLVTSSSPARLSPQGGSQSPDRRPVHHSPRHVTGSPPPPSDCPHPSRKNSLSRHAQPLLFETLSQPVPQAPKQFSRASSGPTPRQQRLSQVAAAERVRHSLRESALRSVSSIHEGNGRPELPPRSFTPTVLSSTGTTV